MGDVLSGAGQVAQNVTMGPGADILTTPEKISRLILTIAGAGPSGTGILTARNQFATENAQIGALASSPQFQELPPDQQDALLKRYGYNYPRGENGNLVLPPIDPREQETFLKSKAGVEDITKARQNYEQAFTYGSPQQAQAAQAAWLRATGHPVPPNAQAAEAGQLAQAGGAMPGLSPTEVTAGPSGPSMKAMVRPEQFSAGGSPTLASATSTANGKPPPESTMPADVQGPGAPSNLKGVTSGPPDVFMIDRGDGRGVRPWRLIQGADGQLTYESMTDKDVAASRAKYEADLKTTQDAANKALNAGLQAHDAAVSVQKTLEPLVDKAFPAQTNHDVAEQNPGYFLGQEYGFHAPWNSNTPQQMFAGVAQQSLAQLAASLHMRPGPRSIEVLAATHYRPGDSAATVRTRLSHLTDLSDEQLKAMLGQAGYTPEQAAANVTGGAAAPVSSAAAPAPGAAMPAHAPAVGMDPDVAAIIRNRALKRKGP